MMNLQVATFPANKSANNNFLHCFYPARIQTGPYRKPIFIVLPKLTPNKHQLMFRLMLKFFVSLYNIFNRFMKNVKFDFFNTITTYKH